MSQKAEKYVRRLERRVDKLEKDMASITAEQISQNARTSAVEDDLAVHRAAEEEVKAAKERRAARAERERQRRIRRCNQVLAFIALALFAAICVVVAAKAYSDAPAAVSATPEIPVAALTTEPLFTAAEVEYMEDPRETEKIEAALLAKSHRIDNVTVTHYCVCEECCGKSPDHPAYGVTASGRMAAPYVSVAVDPSVIQLGADVLVDYGDGEIYYYRADDTGPKGNHIDLCVSSHEEALRLGVQTATVYWVED